MKRVRSKIRLTRAGRGVVACTVAGMAVLALLVFFLIYKVDKVEVVGSTRYTDEEIQEYALKNALTSNSMLAVWFSSHIEAENIPFVESFDLEKVDNHTLRIHVNEKKIIGYIVQGTDKMYFDKDGRVVETLPVEKKEKQEPQTLQGVEAAGGNENATQFHAAVTDVPRVVGLDTGEVKLGEKMEVKEKQVFNTILGITRMVEKYQILPEMVAFNQDLEITLVYNKGKIHCALGKDALLEEKITRVAAILPKLTEETGILHLEDYSTDITNIIFSKESLYTLKREVAKSEGKNIEEFPKNEMPEPEDIPQEDVQ